PQSRAWAPPGSPSCAGSHRCVPATSCAAASTCSRPGARPRSPTVASSACSRRPSTSAGRSSPAGSAGTSTGHGPRADRARGVAGTVESSGGPDDALVEALRGLLRARLGRPVRRIDTHISWVLLDGEHAWKVKKPLRLGFLDFSRIEVRRRCCEEELRLNRRLAPSIYLDVLPVRGSVAAPRLEPEAGGASDGAAANDGDGPPIEYVLRMRQFAPGALFSERLAAGRLAPEEVDRLALRLAAFHTAAPVAGADTDFGGAALVRDTTMDVIAGIESRLRSPEA